MTENNEMYGQNVAENTNLLNTHDKRDVIQLRLKLTPSATQTLYERLVSEDVCVVTEGGASVRTHFLVTLILKIKPFRHVVLRKHQVITPH